MKSFIGGSIKNKKIIKLIDNFEEDDDANMINRANEYTLTKDLKKIIKSSSKTKPKPIDTRVLVKN